MQTVVSIEGSAFLLNGRPTYAGRVYEGMKIEGLLLNARLVQGIFDDLNPETRDRWNYPDGPWDAERNTREFLAAMPLWRAHGLLAFTLNLQGGSPTGYSAAQPWINSAFEPDGSLREDYLSRLERILSRADELGMAVILGLFYFGQEHRLNSEKALFTAVENAVTWLLEKGYANVLIEVANETDSGAYRQPILGVARCHELIQFVQKLTAEKVASPSGRLLVSTSFCGGVIPPDSVAASADFLLIHGNGVDRPERIREMVRACRRLPSYRGQPILFNEDDHFNFEAPENNMLAAVSEYASWGYFDYRTPGEGFAEGFQSVPANWGIGSARKRGFFKLLTKVSGSADKP